MHDKRDMIIGSIIICSLIICTFIVFYHIFITFIPILR